MFSKEFRTELFNYVKECKKKCLDMENYCLMEMYEAKTFEWYSLVSNYAKNNGNTRVFDIGACLGIQGFFFRENDIDYIPVDNYADANINGFLDNLIIKSYPFKIDTCSQDMLISHLCLGYLIKEDDALEYLKDFRHIITDYKLKTAEKYFDVQKMENKIGFSMYHYARRID